MMLALVTAGAGDDTRGTGVGAGVAAGLAAVAGAGDDTRGTGVGATGPAGRCVPVCTSCLRLVLL